MLDIECFQHCLKPLDIKEGNGNVTEYSLEFKTLAASRGWNELVLKVVYHLERAPTCITLNPFTYKSVPYTRNTFHFSF